MICPLCSKTIRDGSEVCEHCGRYIKNSSPANPSEPVGMPNPAPYQQMPIQPQTQQVGYDLPLGHAQQQDHAQQAGYDMPSDFAQQQGYGPSSGFGQQPGKTKLKTPLIVSAIAAVAVIAVALFLILGGNEDTSNQG